MEDLISLKDYPMSFCSLNMTQKIVYNFMKFKLRVIA